MERRTQGPPLGETLRGCTNSTSGGNRLPGGPGAEAVSVFAGRIRRAASCRVAAVAAYCRSAFQPAIHAGRDEGRLGESYRGGEVTVRNYSCVSDVRLLPRGVAVRGADAARVPRRRAAF